MRHRFFFKIPRKPPVLLLHNKRAIDGRPVEKKKDNHKSNTFLFMTAIHLPHYIHTAAAAAEATLPDRGNKTGAPHWERPVIRIFSLKKNKPAHAILMHLWSNTSGANELMVIHIPVATSFAVALLL